MILFYLFDIILWNTITRRERCHLTDFFTPHGWGIAKRVSERSHPENQSTFWTRVGLANHDNRQSHRLLLSAHPVFGRIQLTQTTFENPSQPSTFIMVLRKYLQGALIESIEQVENDRIVEMTVSNKNEIGDHIQATLIIEIMGKHSNILLVDKSSHKILEVIKHVGFSQNSYRTLLMDRPISLRQVRNLSILLQSRTRNSLKSCKHRKRQLKIFKASFKVWDVIRQMNWKRFWLVIN